MRKFYSFLILGTFATQLIYGQANERYKSFKFDIGSGIMTSSGSSGGPVFFMEPSYSFLDRFKIGTRFEIGAVNMKSITSTALIFDYYLASYHRLRIFTGVGYAIFKTDASGGCDPGPSTVQTVSRAKQGGPVLRTGFEICHFRFGLEYNFVPSTYVSALNANGDATSTVVYRNGYFGFKASVLIGGGRKKWPLRASEGTFGRR